LKFRIHCVPVGVAQAYLIENQDGLILVDAGFLGYENRVMRRLETTRRKYLRAILITHAHLDRYGSASKIRELTGAPIAGHISEAEAIFCD